MMIRWDMCVGMVGWSFTPLYNIYWRTEVLGMSNYMSNDRAFAYRTYAGTESG